MSLDVMPSHVAVLVPSARRAAALLGELGFAIGAEEEWEEDVQREGEFGCGFHWGWNC